MITPSFGLTATERVLPKLALDFTTASLDPRITFTRTTNATNPATYINSSGYVTAATNNQPRFDYDPTTLICKGLLIEESRTNVCLQSVSTNFTTSPWVISAGGTGVTPVPTFNAAAAPDGTNSATKFVFNSGSGTTTSDQSQWFQAVVLTAASYTTSLWIRGEVGGEQIYFRDPAAGYQLLTLTTQWQRITYTATGSTSNVTRIGLAIRQGLSGLTINQTASVYVWGAQVELGAFATSYIPTTTAALTRNADVATMTGTNFSDWFNASEGTFVARSASLTTAAATRSIFDVRSATTIRMSLQNYGTYGSFVAVDTTTQASLDGTSTVAANTFFQVAGGYKVNDFGCAANGGAIVTDTSGTVPVANVAWIGGVNGTSVRNGWISNIWYYPQKLTSAQISAFSKKG